MYGKNIMSAENAGGVSIMSRNGAPSRKECVVNDQTTKTNHECEYPPSHPPSLPSSLSLIRCSGRRMCQNLPNVFQLLRATKLARMACRSLRVLHPSARCFPRRPDQQTNNAGSQGSVKLRHPAAVPTRNVQRKRRLRGPPVRATFAFTG